MSSNVIAYADDLVLLAPSAKALQMLIDDAVIGARSLSLEFNDKKTKSLIFRPSISCNKKTIVKSFKVDNKPIEQVFLLNTLGTLLQVVYRIRMILKE